MTKYKSTMVFTFSKSALSTPNSRILPGDIHLLLEMVFQKQNQNATTLPPAAGHPEEGERERGRKEGRKEERKEGNWIGGSWPWPTHREWQMPQA